MKKLLRIILAMTFSSAAIAGQNIGTLSEKLKQSPDDTALREQIIKTAAQMKPRPAIPEAAREHFVMGNTLAKNAKDAAGQKLAADSYIEALKFAPWWGEVYHNLAHAQELTGQFERAEASLKF